MFFFILWFKVYDNFFSILQDISVLKSIIWCDWYTLKNSITTLWGKGAFLKKSLSPTHSKKKLYVYHW